MDEEQAKKKLTSAGLELEVTEYKFNNRVNAGRIISQKEESGSVVEKGSAVHVEVSRGAGEVSTPELIGRTSEDAAAELYDLCLETDVSEEPSDEPPGYIIAQEPAAGTVLEQGQTVKYTVSQGRGFDPSVSWIMEDVRGMSFEEAKALLLSHGIYTLKTGEDYSEEYEEGAVISQNREAGKEVFGEEITEVSVSRGRDPAIVQAELEEEKKKKEAEEKAAAEKAKAEKEAREKAEQEAAARRAEEEEARRQAEEEAARQAEEEAARRSAQQQTVQQQPQPTPQQPDEDQAAREAEAAAEAAAAQAAAEAAAAEAAAAQQAAQPEETMEGRIGY
jgi:serine/threonine-protein kinase